MTMAMAMMCLGSVQFNNICSNCQWGNGKAFCLKNSERFVRNCRIIRGGNNVIKRIRRNLHITASATAIGDVGGDEGVFNMRSDGDDHDRKEVAAQQLDHWLKNSVAEIVKNIGEAPLLVHLYTETGFESSRSPSSSSRMKLVIEKTTSKSWHLIKQRWENNCCAIPNGIILVEELERREDKSAYQQKSEDRTTCTNGDNTNKQLMHCSSSTTKMWGVLVQGREINFPICYLLKTCQVECCFGLSTHFCLAKVDCFGKSLDFHLNKLWLQR